jgi:hypothetical protein
LTLGQKLTFWPISGWVFFLLFNQHIIMATEEDKKRQEEDTKFHNYEDAYHGPWEKFGGKVDLNNPVIESPQIDYRRSIIRTHPDGKFPEQVVLYDMIKYETKVRFVNQDFVIIVFCYIYISCGVVYACDVVIVVLLSLLCCCHCCVLPLCC